MPVATVKKTTQGPNTSKPCADQVVAKIELIDAKQNCTDVALQVGYANGRPWQAAITLVLKTVCLNRQRQVSVIVENDLGWGVFFVVPSEKVITVGRAMDLGERLQLIQLDDGKRAGVEQLFKNDAHGSITCWNVAVIVALFRYGMDFDQSWQIHL